MSDRSRVIAVLVVVVMFAAACGQKSGVANTDVSAPAASATGGSETSDDAGTSREAGPDDTSGVTDDEIIIGLHAPVTGASPLPQTTFDIGKDIYWQFLGASDPDALAGRKVRVVFRDDEFNPSRAVQVCRELVEKENAFILVGGGGADQITACAKYAADAGVPYFSAGVNESGLEDLSTYFALSLTYAQQVPLLIDLIGQLDAEKVGVIVNDTPSFEDAHSAFISAADDAGLDVVVDDAVNKTATEAESLAVIGKLKDADADVVFILTSPLVYLSIASAARSQSYDPVFIGPGITSGLNTVTTFGCPAVGNGRFFSPFPELDVINSLDPDYLSAYEEYGQGEEVDDIGIALWGLNKTIGQMLEATSDDLGRAALMDTVEKGDAFESGVYPPVVYSPDEHFGGTGAHLLEADCAEREYITAEEFVDVGGEQ